MGSEDGESKVKVSKSHTLDSSKQLNILVVTTQGKNWGDASEC